MTVSELIAELQHYPPDMAVVVSGYEGGLTKPGALKVVRDLVTYDAAGYYGWYATPDAVLDDVDPSIPPFDAVVIPR